MNTLEPALLINVLGFALGLSLFAMLFVMVLNHRNGEGKINLLLFVAAILGMIWNAGELTAFVWKDLSGGDISPFVQAVSFSALGFLPAVVLHTLGQNRRLPVTVVLSAYGLGAFATVMHIGSAALGSRSPSSLAFQVLSIGSLLLVVILFARRSWSRSGNRPVLSLALLVFAFSAFHLSTGSEFSSLFLELIAHQSSLPLVIAILIQDYRFAFADIYLKRALSILLIASIAFAAYTLALAPILNLHTTHQPGDPFVVWATLLFWIATAAVFPFVQRCANWFVDRVVLRREDYSEFLQAATELMESQYDEDELLDDLAKRLKDLFTAGEVTVGRESDLPGGAREHVNYAPERALIRIAPGTEPHYCIELVRFAGGRRMLSDEASMLEKLSLAAGRRVASIRAGIEKRKGEERAQELARLAAEARLAALRSQINPHFLFNALTTIGQLIRVAPKSAFLTLMKLNGMLRRILKTESDFCTLQEEIELITDYLDIEKARFEERLSVKIDVPVELESTFIPSLSLQPLVENSVKHAVSKNRRGGRISVTAAKEGGMLVLKVSDTGAGRSTPNSSGGEGIGLENVRERLLNHYGEEASLKIDISEEGSVASVELPLRVTARPEAREGVSSTSASL